MEELLKNIQFQWKIHCFLGPTNKPQVGRKGSNAYDLPEDLEILEDESFDESEDEDDEWIVEDDLAEEELKDPAKPPERRKVEMQILHMSDQSQQLVIQMLKELHGSQYKMRDASAYVDAGQRYFEIVISTSRNGNS